MRRRVCRLLHLHRNSTALTLRNGLQALVNARDAELKQFEDERNQLQATIHDLKTKLGRAELHAYRLGDTIDVTVMSAAIPKDEVDSSMTQSFVMIDIDGRHQVQQSKRVDGYDPVYDCDFTAHLVRESQALGVALYKSERDQPGELLGTAKIEIQNISYAPGLEVCVEVMGEDDTATGATVRLALCRTNVQKTPRQMKREALENDLPSCFDLSKELDATKADLESARDYIAKLEPEVQLVRVLSEREAEANQTIAKLGIEQEHTQACAHEHISHTHFETKSQSFRF